MADQQQPSGTDPMALLSLKEVANRLGCSEKTVERLVLKGHFSRPRRLPSGKAIWFAKDIEVYQYRLLRGDFEEMEGKEAGDSEDD